MTDQGIFDDDRWNKENFTTNKGKDGEKEGQDISPICRKEKMNGIESEAENMNKTKS